MTMAIDRLPLFPITTTIEPTPAGPALHVAGLDLHRLAAEHGTPLYLYDAASLDEAVHQYQQALVDHYPAGHGLTYAGKAFLCAAVARWSQGHDLWVDCTGVGEIEIAQAGGVPPAHILVHGVNKSQADLIAAVQSAGTIVVDNLTELDRLAGLLARNIGRQPNLWLRYRPGLAVDTHRHTQTGQTDSKFGMSTEEVLFAARRCREAGLPLNGLHFHQGSFFTEAEPVGEALESALNLLGELETDGDWTLCPGGGWGVAYHEDDLPHPDIGAFVRFLVDRVVSGCELRGLPLPRLQLEPGRSLVARSGVALYTMGALKQTRDRRWLLLDGGLADNPRPALYGARYAALPARNPARPDAGPAWLAGPYCESGDILIEDLPLPEIETGELVAVPVSGAYHLSMSSNYNGARRPAVVWLEDGQSHLIQARETIADLYRRDLLPGSSRPAVPASRLIGLGDARPDRKLIGFHKYQALGNDYILLKPTDFPQGPSPETIRRICDRHFGIGGDGVLFGPIGNSISEFNLRIFNPDGSEAETSGNGLRIFARYLWDMGLAGEEPITLRTGRAAARAWVRGEGQEVRLEMGKPSFDSREIPVAGPPRQVLQEQLAVRGQAFTYSAVSVGNPHCVIVQDSVSPEKARRWGPAIETESRFPNRTNVQFVQILNRRTLRLEIWERGAGYTLASGSSSCAAAAVTYRLGLTEPEVEVQMPGGMLQVAIGAEGMLELGGPVFEVFEGQLSHEAFQK